ncbi:hypothetical protein [Salinivibrio sp. VYel1]|uniref:hypothetical protein n=1 Tax=Salinivibrio sp. VYel1 TaxID=2490490 RepID=UPI00128BA638|nr:hypothetical protein [Salinivibrio sp. VYel1]MPX92113.1 hypothetical protein [Salinivibrio sp. VYel1]
MKIAVYVKRSSYINDATSFYVSLIASSTDSQYVGVITNLSDLSGVDIVVTVYSIDAIYVKIKFPRKKVYNWYQGISPEESKMFGLSRFIYIRRTISEYLSLKIVDGAFFVSQAMKEHYKKKYGSRAPSLVMPCFNKVIGKKSDFINNFKKKEKNKFVYAGGLQSWQCIEETLKLHRGIQDLIENTSLTFLCSDSEKANELAKKYMIKNFETKYVSLEDLDEELQKYNFGYLIRREHIVNKVSTPTKLSSYLANGVKVISTDAIEAFNIIDSINIYRFSSNDISANKEIVNFINQDISPESLYSDLSSIFEKHFCISEYQDKIRDFVK